MPSRHPSTRLKRDEKSGYRIYAAELAGTFVLTFSDCGVAVAAALLPGGIGLGARAATAGLAVMAVIFALGQMSGAHINPAVTLAFALRRDFPWARLPGYWAAQFAGAVAAAVLLLGIFGDVGDLGVTLPRGGALTSFLLETALSAVLVFVILCTSHEARVTGPESAFPVGATVAVCGLLGKGISGASMNPARSLGPALVGGRLELVWIYFAGPLLGASLAVAAVWLVYGSPQQTEARAAQGD